jgi:uncharacterized protein YjbI with pentapeptide repeats
MSRLRQSRDRIDARAARTSSHAGLDYTNLTRANLRTAGLIKADLIRANFTGADLTCADLFGANLTGAITATAWWAKSTCPNGRATNTGC